MKNAILIMMLALCLGACSSQPAIQDDSGALLSFADLATEITVQYEAIESPALSRSTSTASDETTGSP